MRTLNWLDWAIIGSYTLLCIVTGFYFTRKANESTEQYFLGGRSMPWWLLGTSMAATNFSSDTPLAVTKYIYQEGIAGVWFFWSGAIQVCLATFVFSQLWRRAEIVTDVEIVEKRYGGRPAKILRVYKGIYFGLIMNSIVMGWVYKGLIKIMTGVTTLNTMQVIVIFTAIVVLYTIAAGFRGVVWTDFIQYFIAVAGCFVLAYFSVDAAGGLTVMLDKLTALYGTESGITNMYPHWPQAEQWMPMSVFMTYLWIQWWAHKYSDGGGKHIQRMSSARTEKDAILGTFYFSFMNYIVQVWPWILTALAALVLIGRDIKDPEMAYPMMIAKVLPNGWLGLLVVMAIAAFMSTIATHTNLGSAYMVNDLYRRFIHTKASDQHYLMASKVATLITLALSISVAMYMESIGNAWKVVIEMTSGAGITWVLRWFWWRVNAWTELSAMVASSIVTIIIELTAPKMVFSHKLWIIIGVSTAVWVTVTYLTKPTDDAVLRTFVEQVGPAKFGWRRIYAEHNLTTKFSMRRCLVNFAFGLLFLFAFNFGVGNTLLGNRTVGLLQLALAVATFVFLLKRIDEQSSKHAHGKPPKKTRATTRASAAANE